MATTRVNGIAFHTELAGPEGAPVIAFSNSLGAAAGMWQTVVPRLSGRYRCLTYDTRGHGKSGGFDTPVTVDDLADDLAGILAAQGVASAHIVGLSLGGLTAQALASRLPEKVRTLTLVATGPILPPSDMWLKRAATVRAEGPEAIFEAMPSRWFTEKFREDNPGIVAETRANFMMVDRAGYARCCEAIASADLRGRLGAIRAPTLIVAGALDPVAPPKLAETMLEIPGAEIVVLPNVAHLISVEQPAEIAEHLLAFLARAADTNAP